VSSTARTYTFVVFFLMNFCFIFLEVVLAAGALTSFFFAVLPIFYFWQ